MKPLLVFLAVFILTLLFQRFVKAKIDWALAGRIGMSVMLLFTAMGHFMFSEGMAMMIPDFKTGAGLSDRSIRNRCCNWLTSA